MPNEWETPEAIPSGPAWMFPVLNTIPKLKRYTDRLEPARFCGILPKTGALRAKM